MAGARARDDQGLEGIVRGPSARVSRLDHDEAVATCAKIEAKHPDILERRPDGLYAYLLGGEDQRTALFDFLACDRVATAWARKRPAKVADLERMQQAEGKY